MPIRIPRPIAAITAVVALLVAVGPAPAQDKKKRVDVDESVKKGLTWLAKQQSSDGSWQANGGAYPTVCTGLAGMAMLMEGSTLREGKYSDNLVKAVEWFNTRSQRNGLLGLPNSPTEAGRYTYGHGYGLMFLACAYGEEDDKDRRKKLEDLIQRAVDFTCKAQTKQGGWGYVSAADGNQFDEGSTTVTQLQALRAARNAGIAVPKGVIDNATEYLRKCTTPRGGLIYNLGPSGQVPQNGAERPPITAAACACAFSAGNYDDKYAKLWIKYCQEVIWNGGRHGAGGGHDDYQTYYFGQVVFALGDDRYAELFPNEKPENRMTWSKYRDNLYEFLKSRQGGDGGWTGGFDGNGIIVTCFNLTLLQLEKGLLPMYHR